MERNGSSLRKERRIEIPVLPVEVVLRFHVYENVYLILQLKSTEIQTNMPNFLGSCWP